MNPVIVLLSITAGSVGLALRSVEPMLPILATEFSVTVPAAAQLITVFTLFYAVSQLVHGPLGDRFGKLLVIQVMVLCSALTYAGCGLAPDLASLTMWRAASGAVSSAMFILGMAYIGDTVEVDERPIAIAQYFIGNVTGHATGPLLSGVVIDTLGWRAMFFVLAGIFATVAVTMAFLTREHRKAERTLPPSGNPVRRYVEVARLPKVQIFAAVSMTEAFLYFGAYAYLGAMLRERFDLSFTLIGLALAGFGVGGLLFGVSIRWVIRRLGPRQLVLSGGLLCGALYVLAAWLPVSWPIYPIMIGVGFTFYMLHNVMQTRATEASPHARGLGMSLFGASWSVGQSLGVAVMGAGISVFGFAPMITLFGVGFAALGICMRLNMHRMT